MLTQNTTDLPISRAHPRAQPREQWSSATRVPAHRLALRLTVFLIVGIGFSLYSPNLALKSALTCAMMAIVLMAGLRLVAIGMLILPTTKTNISDLSTWPKFTVLVPLYQETRVVPILMENLAKLDYPQDKLQIIMVCEADDRPTCEAVRAHLRSPFEIYEVSPSQPRTKPKALNVTLASIPAHLRGDIITIFDAEDRPHPFQLKAAAFALHTNPKLAAVQAPLGYYNARHNLLTAFFALEYAALFHVWNPAIARLRLPFTLGGTSNHIRRTVLEAVGGWDSHNVTEDADLSFRISAAHGTGLPVKIGCIGYGTQEEAVSNPKDWIDQRSRWLKGFMQTWAVHMRPKQLGPTGAPFKYLPRISNTIALQITVGITLLAAFLHVPSLLILGGVTIAHAIGLIEYSPPVSFFALMGFGYGASILTMMLGAIKEGKPWLILYALFTPLYWLLHFPAAIIAAYEFVFNPNYWRKTSHKGPTPTPAQHRPQNLPLEEPKRTPI